MASPDLPDSWAIGEHDVIVISYSDIYSMLMAAQKSAEFSLGWNENAWQDPLTLALDKGHTVLKGNLNDNKAHVLITYVEAGKLQGLDHKDPG